MRGRRSGACRLRGKEIRYKKLLQSVNLVAENRAFTLLFRGVHRNKPERRTDCQNLQPHARAEHRAQHSRRANAVDGRDFDRAVAQHVDDVDEVHLVPLGESAEAERAQLRAGLDEGGDAVGRESEVDEDEAAEVSEG